MALPNFDTLKGTLLGGRHLCRREIGRKTRFAIFQLCSNFLQTLHVFRSLYLFTAWLALLNRRQGELIEIILVIIAWIIVLLFEKNPLRKIIHPIYFSERGHA